MPENVDLHCHSTASDGSLSPKSLLARAAWRQIDWLALTDHDTVAGLHWLLDNGWPPSVALVPGCEFSTTWGRHCIHIVALGFDVKHPGVMALIDTQCQARLARNHFIAAKLARRLADSSAGDCYEGAQQQALQRQQHDSHGFSVPPQQVQIGRPHFADWLVQKGVVGSRDGAFDRYLSGKRLGKMEHFWPDMAEIVATIASWGGLPVLAHPGKYRLSALQLTTLITQFKEAGGTAIEVVGSRQQRGERAQLAQLCVAHDLYASTGSDFHRPGLAAIELGQPGALPPMCRSVCELMSASNNGDPACGTVVLARTAQRPQPLSAESVL